jgi:hypothetical protein
MSFGGSGIQDIMNDARSVKQGLNPAPAQTGPQLDAQGKAVAVPVYHEGIDRVPKTGLAIVKKDEAVLPQHEAEMYREYAAHGLAHGKHHEAKKHLKEMHIKELHTGGYLVHKHDGNGGMTEHGANDLDEVHDHMEDHMGMPNEGEEAEAEPAAAPMEEPA